MKIKKIFFSSEYLVLIIGGLILLIFTLFSLFPECFSAYGPKDMFKPWLGCSSSHLLGTNDMGYDIFTELIYASSTTLKVGSSAAFFSMIIGTIIGMLAGFIKGFFGEVINMIIQIFLLIPMLPMAIVLAAYLGSGSLNIIITIAIMGWCATAKTVRAKTLQLKHTEFIDSQRIMGFSQIHILIYHILPNLREVIFARFIMTTASAMFTEASLSFLGLGDPVNVTWGGMINFAYKRGGFVKGAYNWFAAPGFCITLCVLALYCLNYYIERHSTVVEGNIKSKEM